jgi:hypothetical protein
MCDCFLPDLEVLTVWASADCESLSEHFFLMLFDCFNQSNWNFVRCFKIVEQTSIISLLPWSWTEMELSFLTGIVSIVQIFQATRGVFLISMPFFCRSVHRVGSICPSGRLMDLLTWSRKISVTQHMSLFEVPQGRPPVWSCCLYSLFGLAMFSLCSARSDWNMATRGWESVLLVLI